MYTLASSEDPEKIPHNAAFHHCLHFLIRQKSLHRNFKEILFVEIIVCDPQIMK